MAADEDRDTDEGQATLGDFGADDEREEIDAIRENVDRLTSDLATLTENQQDFTATLADVGDAGLEEGGADGVDEAEDPAPPLQGYR